MSILCLIGKGKRCMIMNNVENKNQIIDIDGYVHVVNGKVICFKPDVYDLNNPEDVEDLVSLSAKMNSEDDDFCYRMYGDDTFLFVEKETNADSLYVEPGDFGCLPENYKKKIEVVLNEIK